ncbi:MAG TPA: LysR substrate-binding domain-containing protein [Stellaceae bacterium]|nr:LysR substrate-binding domain-containing protein [Stellaceae bacterium]
MFDLDLLRSFVSIVDSGGFTRAGAHVRRTQSTMSQQMRRLEDDVGKKLLLRDRAHGTVLPTETGEVLLGYARRLLALADEARDVLAAERPVSVVRLGVPEDFAGRRLTDLLAGVARQYPDIRLDTASGLSTDLSRDLDEGTLDLALVKREATGAPALAIWPEQAVWVAGQEADPSAEPVPLAVFPPGCIYRARAVAALEQAGRRWRIAYASQGLIGVQAAVASGLGIAILASDAVLPAHRLLRGEDGFEPLPPTELALVAGAIRPAPAVKRIAEHLAVADLR